MELRKLNQIAEALLKHYPPDTEVWLDDEHIMILHNGEKKNLDIDDVASLENESQINWDGISAVRAWSRGPKERVYFRCVGIPDSAHKAGKVFIEKVSGQWIPNMRYPLMTGLADQLNSVGLFDIEDIERKYEDYMSSY